MRKAIEVLFLTLSVVLTVFAVYSGNAVSAAVCGFAVGLWVFNLLNEC